MKRTTYKGVPRYLTIYLVQTPNSWRGEEVVESFEGGRHAIGSLFFAMIGQAADVGLGRYVPCPTECHVVFRRLFIQLNINQIDGGKEGTGLKTGRSRMEERKDLV